MNNPIPLDLAARLCAAYYGTCGRSFNEDMQTVLAAHLPELAALPAVRDLVLASPTCPDAERDRLARLLDEPRRSGCAVEIAGVRIAPCDERGQTADMRERDALRAELAHMTEARDNARAEVGRLTGQIEAAKRICLGTHLGRPWHAVLDDVLRALDGAES